MVPKMSFELLKDGMQITFDNGWTVRAYKHGADAGKVKIQAFMPRGFLIRIYGSEFFIVTCNDLAVILIQASEIAKGIEVSEEYATQSFEAMIEGLIFGVAA